MYMYIQCPDGYKLGAGMDARLLRGLYGLAPDREVHYRQPYGPKFYSNSVSHSL